MAYKNTRSDVNNEIPCGDDVIDDEDLYELWNQYISFYKTLIIQLLNPIEMVVSGNFGHDIIPTSTARKIFKLDLDGQQEEAAEALIDAILESKDKLKWKIFEQAAKEPGNELIQDILSGSIHEYLETHDHYQRLIHQIFLRKIVEKLEQPEAMEKCYECSLLTQQGREKVKAHYDNHGSSAATILLLYYIPRTKNWYSCFLKILWEMDQKDLVSDIDPDIYEKLLAQEEGACETGEYQGAVNNDCGVQEKEQHVAEGVQEAVMYGSGQPSSSSKLLCAQENVKLENRQFIEECTFKEKASQSLSMMESTSVKFGEVAKSELVQNDEDCTSEGKASQSLRDTESTNVKYAENVKLIQNQTGDGCSLDENLQQSMNITEFPDDKILGSKTIPKKEAEKLVDELNDISRTELTELKQSQASSTIGSKTVLREEAEKPVDDPNNIIRTELTELKQSQALSTIDSDDESNLAVAAVLPEPEKNVAKDKEFTLRSYQSELAEKACQGKNVIICAPTGSGKTHIALHIISNHMASVKGRKGKVVFLVNQKALAEQQLNVLKDHLGVRYQCIQVSGDAKLAIPFKTVVEKFDIIVVTAQILVDTLRSDVESIQVFSLIVFDECHHTKDKHPFNSIMLRYLKEKYPDVKNPQNVRNGMPQIVGLTASLGVGKAKNEDAAVTHIRQIFANLDVEEICIVERNKKQLADFTNTAEHSIIPCPARGNDEFKKIVDTVMETIEQKMAKSCGNTQTGDSILKLPCSDKRWSPAYFQLISKMFREFARITDDDLRRELESARRFLVIYYNALTINEDCRTKDAFLYLEEKMKKVEKDGRDTSTSFEERLHELYIKHRPILDNAYTNDSSENPKLKRLYELIHDCFGENRDSRIIVFVRTRELANALELWMKDTPDLKSLSPKKMVGACATAEKGGMTQRQQVDVMSALREGRHKIIVATSVAQEGLDVPKCNMVIQYDYNTNEIAMVQARGRARAENSQYAVIASKDSTVEKKEMVNLEREKLMNEAIQTLKSEMANDVEDYERMKRQHQLGNLSTMILHESTRQRNIVEGEFKLTCEHCGRLACFSNDICTIKASQHVVIDPLFKNQIKVKVHPRPNSFSGLEKKGKLHCRGCSDEWGIVIKHKGHFYPVIKIEQFRVEDNLGGYKTFRSWREVNFVIRSLEIDENTCNIDSSCDCLLGQ